MWCFPEQFQSGVSSFTYFKPYPISNLFLFNRVEQHKINLTVIISDSGLEKPRGKFWSQAVWDTQNTYSWASKTSQEQACRSHMFTHPTEPEVNIQAQIHPYTQTGRFNRKTDKTFPQENHDRWPTYKSWNKHLQYIAAHKKP